MLSTPRTSFSLQELQQEEVFAWVSLPGIRWLDHMGKWNAARDKDADFSCRVEDSPLHLLFKEYFYSTCLDLFYIFWLWDPITFISKDEASCSLQSVLLQSGNYGAWAGETELTPHLGIDHLAWPCLGESEPLECLLGHCTYPTSWCVWLSLLHV